jgi:DNA-binding NarL/FixJ family response regulator
MADLGACLGASHGQWYTMEVSMAAPSIRVLVVDDFAAWRRFVCLKVQNQPQLQIIAEASDGLEAIEKAQELQPDLILLDIGLPALNGIEAASRIHEIAQGTRILFVSESNDPELVRAALSNGARGYILKTDAEDELLPAIGAVMRDERIVSGRLKHQVVDS